MDEIWKDMPGYENLYQASNLGRIRSLPRNTTKGKVLSMYIDKYGYCNTILCVHGKKFIKKVHRLIAMAFLDNPYSLPCINHKDEDKTNNFIFVNPDGTVDHDKSNLEWCSISYNNHYGTRDERALKNRKGKTAEQPVISIDKDNKVNFYKSVCEASRETGILQSCISMVVNGKRRTAGGYVWKKGDCSPS